VPPVYVISGPMAVGKSSVARLLAGRFERGVHLEGDVFRRSIVSGRAETTPSSDDEADDQLRLRYRLAAAAADMYAEAGFTVVLEDVVAGEHLRDLRTSIRSRPCHVFVLTARADVLERRDAARRGTGYGTWSAEELLGVFFDATPRLGVWLDTSDLDPNSTVDAILTTPTPTSPVEIAE
jgi:predicted kinase